MKLGIADVIALVKAGYKMSDIKSLMEEKPEEKTEEKTEEKPEENPEEKPEENLEEKKPNVEDLKNQIRDLTSQIKTMQEINKEIDVSHNKEIEKPNDNELMLDLFRTFM